MHTEVMQSVGVCCVDFDLRPFVCLDLFDQREEAVNELITSTHRLKFQR